jgi:hypothetical protein
MNEAEKMGLLKKLLGIDAADKSQDRMLCAYLSMAQAEILNWMYINYQDRPEDAMMPTKYDITQVHAVVAGFNLQGGENEMRHSENGITRVFQFSDMVDYIRAHVYQLVVI